MNKAEKTTRLTEFFQELGGHYQFMDCTDIGVHTRGFQGETPLKIAVVRGDIQTVGDLLDLGADPNLKGEDDWTPLHHAVSRGNVAIISLLLAHGASPEMTDRFGKTPASIARTLHDPEVSDLLSRHTPA